MTFFHLQHASNFAASFLNSLGRQIKYEEELDILQRKTTEAQIPN